MEYIGLHSIVPERNECLTKYSKKSNEHFTLHGSWGALSAALNPVVGKPDSQMAERS